LFLVGFYTCYLFICSLPAKHNTGKLMWSCVARGTAALVARTWAVVTLGAVTVLTPVLTVCRSLDIGNFNTVGRLVAQTLFVSFRLLEVPRLFEHPPVQRVPGPKVGESLARSISHAVL